MLYLLSFFLSLKQAASGQDLPNELRLAGGGGGAFAGLQGPLTADALSPSASHRGSTARNQMIQEFIKQAEQQQGDATKGAFKPN